MFPVLGHAAMRKNVSEQSAMTSVLRFFSYSEVKRHAQVPPLGTAVSACPLARCNSAAVDSSAQYVYCTLHPPAAFAAPELHVGALTCDYVFAYML